jgi:hypothetical protein
MKLANTRTSEMVFVVAAFIVMEGCGPGTLEHGQSGAHESTSKSRNVIPATVAAILEQADHFDLLSLDPHFRGKAAKDDFHGYKVLGTAVIEDPETRKRIASAFKRAVAENQGYMAACFNPRHGIRVTRNMKQADFVICFECAQVEVFGENYGRFLISNSAQPLFDSVLRSSGIPREDR